MLDGAGGIWANGPGQVNFLRGREGKVLHGR